MAYSEEEKNKILESIFEKIENGTSTRKAIIEAGIPAKTFYLWIDADDDKCKQYARACELRADALVDEMLDMADENNADVYLDDDGNTQIDGNAIQRSKLKVDTRKWLISKLAPKKYGDKLEVENSGSIAINWNEEKTYKKDE